MAVTPHPPHAPPAPPPGVLPAAPAWESRLSKFGGYLPGLDGLRGVAIVLVMLHHFAMPGQARSGVGRGVLKAFETGWCGVDLFFVLSGFLITGILLDTKGQEGYFRNFYARRTLRIFPLYYGVLFLVLLVPPLLSLADAGPSPAAANTGWLWTYTTNLPMTFAPARQPAHEHVQFNHFWSLAVEEQFYLVWPAVVLLCGRRTLVWVGAGSVVLGIATRWYLIERIGLDPVKAYFFTASRIDGLGVGALLAAWLRLPGGFEAARRAAKWAAPASVAALLLLGASQSLSTLQPDRYLKHSAFAVLFGALLVIVIAAPQGSAVAAAAANPVLRFLGKYSYGLYVFHYLLQPIFLRLFPPQSLRFGGPPLLGDLAYVALASLVSIAVAFVSWHAYEKWFLRLKRFFDYKKSFDEPSAAAGPAPATPAA